MLQIHGIAEKLTKQRADFLKSHVILFMLFSVNEILLIRRKGKKIIEYFYVL
ncbi:hypothetical protein U722_09300 [Bacillus amyloliquefaciens LFB112]|nr:hypothetical protein U722_09300 [Bacillus amyloliquefaciens LFB112]